MTDTLQRIDAAITELHNSGLKITQVRVMKITGLSRSTIYNYWSRTIKPADIEWLKTIRQKAKEINL